MAKSTSKTQTRPQEKGAAPPAIGRERQPFDRLRTEIDRLFEDFGRGTWPTPFFGRSLEAEPFWRRNFSFSGVPAIDIAEKDGSYEITAELPGMEEKDIDVQFSDGTLVIKGEKKEEREEKKKDYHLSERHFGSFRRSFRVPEGVDADRIAAEFRNGVLTLTLPKSAQAMKKERKIAVNVK
jgi:HSP20 family protein